MLRKRRQVTLHHTGRNDLSGGKSGHVLQGFVFGGLILRKTQEKLIMHSFTGQKDEPFGTKPGLKETSEVS